MSSILAVVLQYNEWMSLHPYYTRLQAEYITVYANRFYQWYIDNELHHSRNFSSDVMSMDMLAWQKYGVKLRRDVNANEFFAQFYCLVHGIKK